MHESESPATLTSHLAGFDGPVVCFTMLGDVGSFRLGRALFGIWPLRGGLQSRDLLTAARCRVSSDL